MTFFGTEGARLGDGDDRISSTDALLFTTPKLGEWGVKDERVSLSALGVSVVTKATREFLKLFGLEAER